MPEVIIFYHHNCLDGFGSAWAAWKKLKDKAEYHGVSYFNFSFEGIKNKKVYFLDVSPSLKNIEILKRNNNQLVIIDHHISTENKLEMFDESLFSLDSSSSILAFKYFFPDKKPPKILTYINDIDLWKFEVPFSREITLALKIMSFDFEEWDRIAGEIEKIKSRKKYIKIGEVINNHQDYLIEDIVSNARLVKMEGWEILAANSPVLASEVGNALVKKCPPMGIICFEGSDHKRVSLRSNGEVDVSKIAEKYGGGGHKGAAAFYLPLEAPWPWEEIQEV